MRDVCVQTSRKHFCEGSPSRPGRPRRPCERPGRPRPPDQRPGQRPGPMSAARWVTRSLSTESQRAETVKSLTGLVISPACAAVKTRRVVVSHAACAAAWACGGHAVHINLAVHMFVPRPRPTPPPRDRYAVIHDTPKRLHVRFCPFRTANRTDGPVSGWKAAGPPGHGRSPGSVTVGHGHSPGSVTGVAQGDLSPP